MPRNHRHEFFHPPHLSIDPDRLHGFLDEAEAAAQALSAGQAHLARLHQAQTTGTSINPRDLVGPGEVGRLREQMQALQTDLKHAEEESDRSGRAEAIRAKLSKLGEELAIATRAEASRNRELIAKLEWGRGCARYAREHGFRSARLSAFLADHVDLGVEVVR